MNDGSGGLGVVEALPTVLAQKAALLNTIPDMAWLKDPQSRYVAVNPALAALIGRPAHEIVGRHDDEVHTPEHAARFVEQDRIVELTGEALRTEEPFVHADGTALVFETVKVPFLNPDGSFGGTVGISRDITRRKRVEAELAERARQQQALAAFCNAALRGGSERDLEQALVQAVEHGLAADVTEIRLCLERCDCELTPGDGTGHCVDLHIGDGAQRRGVIRVRRDRAFSDDDRQFLQAAADVAAQAVQRRAAEQALLRTNSKLFAILDTSPVATIAVDCELRVALWNRAAERLFGWTADEVLGRPYPLQGPEGEPRARDLLRGGSAGDRMEGVETRRLTRDGRMLDVTLFTEVLRDEADGIAGLVVLLIDQTERRRLEQQFRQAQKLEAVGRLAGGVAHDFNNILTVVGGHASLLLDGVDDADPMRDDLLQIRRGVEQATGLTRQLLAFSRKQVMKTSVVDPARLVSDARRMLRRLIGEDIQLEVRIDASVANVRVDPVQFEQVLLNLAVNSRDAMPDGGLLELRLRNVEVDAPRAASLSGLVPGSYVLLSVRDTGEGIPAELLPHIFEPFFTSKAIGKGTGLGLSTVYGVVKQSGGFIFVGSTQGVGTEFSIYLPQVDEQAEVGADTAQPAAAGGRETILVIEDEPAVRMLMRNVLARKGYDVIAAEGGAEALLLADRLQAPIHLLVTDVVMPHMNGRAVADRLLQGRPDMKVLFVSGYAEDAISDRGVLQDGVNFLQKPFEPAALAARVRDILG